MWVLVCGLSCGYERERVKCAGEGGGRLTALWYQEMYKNSCGVLKNWTPNHYIVFYLSIHTLEKDCFP